MSGYEHHRAIFSNLQDCAAALEWSRSKIGDPLVSAVIDLTIDQRHAIGQRDKSAGVVGDLEDLIERHSSSPCYAALKDTLVRSRLDSTYLFAPGEPVAHDGQGRIEASPLKEDDYWQRQYKADGPSKGEAGTVRTVESKVVRLKRGPGLF